MRHFEKLAGYLSVSDRKSTFRLGDDAQPKISGFQASRSSSVTSVLQKTLSPILKNTSFGQSHLTQTPSQTGLPCFIGTDTSLKDDGLALFGWTLFLRRAMKLPNKEIASFVGPVDSNPAGNSSTSKGGIICCYQLHSPVEQQCSSNL